MNTTPGPLEHLAAFSIVLIAGIAAGVALACSLRTPLRRP